MCLVRREVFSAGRDAPALRQAGCPPLQDLRAAQAAAYAAVECIQFEGAHFSCDIAAKGANLLGCAETHPSFDSSFVS